METGAIIALVLAVLVVGGLVTWFVIRQRYIKSIEERGWQWIGKADVNITVGLNIAPFGLGFQRKTGHLIEGRSRSGQPFRAFEYSSDHGSVPGLVLTMPLPKTLPHLYIFPTAEGRRMGVQGTQLAAGPLTAVTADPSFGEQAMGALRPFLDSIPLPESDPHPVDLTIDHGHLVLLGVPKKVEHLEACVDWLAQVHQALTSSAAMEFTGPDAPRHLSFAGRDYWRFIPRDDSFLSRVSYDRSGFDHQAHDIIVSDNHGLPFVRLHHKWKTRHTTRDSNGRTRTEIRNHDEYLCEFATTFPFAELSVNWGLFSGSVTKFESEQFNKAFKVRAPVARFASDVMHPRQMEYMLRTRVPAFSIEQNGTIQVRDGNRWHPADIDAVTHFFRGFFANVPNFVWQELGAPQAPQLEPPTR